MRPTSLPAEGGTAVKIISSWHNMLSFWVSSIFLLISSAIGSFKEYFGYEIRPFFQNVSQTDFFETILSSNVHPIFHFLGRLFNSAKSSYSYESPWRDF